MITASRSIARLTIATATMLAALLVAPYASAASVQQQRDEAVKTAKDTLNRLYKMQPSARKTVEGAAGYAVFTAIGTKIFLAGGGTGSGVAVNNKTKAVTYMKMVELQAGLGMGIKKFRLIWVFERSADLDSFINSGYEFGAQASAAAKTGSKGESFEGAMSIRPGVWLYQLTDDGLALELTAKGTKYYKNSDLN